MQQYLLGIDVGTTGTKTLLIAADGRVISHAYRSYEILAPAVGFSEQRAEDWWEAVVATVRETVSAVDHPEDVKAISLSLQGGTVVPVDAAYRPLRNAIVWNDGRAGEQFEEFVREGGSDRYTYETCGWHMAAGLPALEVRWIRDHQPEIFDRTARFLTVPDYISWKMTGRAVTDLADAGINEFCDIRRGVYDEKLMAFAGIGPGQLAQLAHTGDLIGPLTPAAAEELGLTTDTVLVTGAHDQYAVAVGAGANEAGDVVVGSGTAWVVTGIFDEPLFESGLAQSVAAPPGKWGSLFSLSTGGICMEWLRCQIAGGLTYEEINRKTAGRMPACDELFFYPFMGIAGVDKRFSRASFVGLDLSHDMYDQMSAVMEGVVFQTRWMMESFKDRSDGIIRLAGGATKSPVWTQMIADIFGRPVLVPEIADLSCIGAAVIAGWGAGLYGSVQEGCQALRISGRQIEPDPERAAVYEHAYTAYKKQAQYLFDLYTASNGSHTSQ